MCVKLSSVAGPDLAGGGPGAQAPYTPLHLLNPVLVSGPESHRVNYALQCITGTTNKFSTVFSIGLQELLN